MTVNINDIIKNISETVAAHRLNGEGEYTRWLWNGAENERKLGLNEYGCADAANILYTIGEFPSESDKRKAWINTLQNFQDPETGLFTEATHHFIHTTAHCTAALELFDAKPRYKFKALEEYTSVSGLYGLLENLLWKEDAWTQSHQGAGIYAALVLNDSVDEKWVDSYFDWLWENSDPETGMWRKGAIEASSLPLAHHMAGTFHYLFNHEYAHRPLRYPEKLIDTCITLYDDKLLGKNFGKQISFLEVDWVYCINRASRQTSHRRSDCQRVLAEFAAEFTEYLNGIDVKTHDGFNDLHALFGATCAIAELQQALPGMLRSKKPLKLVLDRRPFI